MLHFLNRLKSIFLRSFFIIIFSLLTFLSVKLFLILSLIFTFTHFLFKVILMNIYDIFTILLQVLNVLNVFQADS